MIYGSCGVHLQEACKKEGETRERRGRRRGFPHKKLANAPEGGPGGSCGEDGKTLRDSIYGGNDAGRLTTDDKRKIVKLGRGGDPRGMTQVSWSNGETTFARIHES